MLEEFTTAELTYLRHRVNVLELELAAADADKEQLRICTGYWKDKYYAVRGTNADPVVGDYA